MSHQADKDSAGNTGAKGRNLPSNPHDALFRALLASPERAAALLRGALPEEIRALLSDAPPKQIDGSFVDEALRGSQSDLLFKVELNSKELDAMYVLLEHKSRPDPGTPLQLMGYKANIWKRHAQGKADRLRALPPILSVVFYHGASRWTIPGSSLDMIESTEALLPWIDRFSYILHDLGQIDPALLWDDPAVYAGLMTLKHSHRDHVTQEELIRILSALSAVDGSFEISVLHYIVQRYLCAAEELNAALRVAQPERWETLMSTIAETWLKEGEARGLARGEARGLARGEARGLAKGEARGKAEGLAKGEARGKAKGLAEGKADTLTRQLERRFGALPADVTSQIAKANLDQLDGWLDAVLDAPDLQAVLNGAATH